MICLPKKGAEVYITMNSGAVYRGIFQWYKDIGGGRILLQDVKIVSRSNNDKWLICPKKSINRKFWISKIKHIKFEWKDGLL